MFIIIYLLTSLISDIYNVFTGVLGAESLDAAVNHIYFPRFMIYLSIAFTFFAIFAFNIIFNNVMRPIAVFIMARHAGFRHAWVAFLPYGTHYVEFVLPMSEFNVLNLFKSSSRETMAWTYILCHFFSPVIQFVIGFIPIIGRFGGILVSMFFILFRWRKCYDLLNTFQIKWSPMALSVLATIFNPLYYILLFVMCDRAPNYGWGRFDFPILIDRYGEVIE